MKAEQKYTSNDSDLLVKNFMYSNRFSAIYLQSMASSAIVYTDSSFPVLLVLFQQTATLTLSCSICSELSPREPQIKTRSVNQNVFTCRT